MLISLFSDASICHEKRVGGWAAWMKCNRGAMRTGAAFGVSIGDTTMAEAMAVVNGLTCGVRDGIILPGDEVLVQTDNDAVMGILTGTALRKVTRVSKKRRKLSWAELKEDVAERNREILFISRTFLSLIDGSGIEVRWRHVKGHKGTKDPRSAVNTFCDKVAKGHMRAARGRRLPSMAERNGLTRLSA
jgi:ribonuclease HI